MSGLHLALDVRDAAYIAAGDAYVVATTPTARELVRLLECAEILK